MKKKLLSTLMCLTLLVGATASLASCDKAATFYTISELLDYDYGTSQFYLTGEKVRIENVICTGTHGRTITVEESNSTTAIEVVLSDKSPSVTMTTLINVEGTLATTNGRAQIVDAIAETVDSSQQNFYYTSALATSYGFDSYGRENSGVIGGGIQANGYDPAKFKIVSYNGATEYVPGEDLILSVAYLGSDYTDPYNWLTMVLFGDSDESFIQYFNAFFFGTDTMVSWTGPFGTRANRSVINAGWEGLEEGDYFSCDLVHFFYDDVYNPSYGSMFFIDDVCLAYAEKLDLYNEQSDLGDTFTALNQAFKEGDEEKAHYTNTITYTSYKGEEISLDEYYSMTSSKQREYLNNCETDVDNITIDVTPSRLVFTETYYYEEDDFDFNCEVLYNYTDNGIPCVAGLIFTTQDALDQFLAAPSAENFDADGEYSYLYVVDVGYSWTDEVYSLYDMYIYSMNFHQEGSSYDVNDPTVSDALWDCLDGFAFGYSDYYEYYGAMFNLSTLTYSATSGALRCIYEYDGWYYGDASYSTVYYQGQEIDNQVQLYL